MKKRFCLLLCIALLLTGCSLPVHRFKEPVNFYYLRSDYAYGQANGVIVAEEREASGHRENLSYLLALYRMGPSREDLKLPVPEGTSIILSGQTEEEVSVILGSGANIITDAEFTLACACLTMTCLELTDVEKVTVTNAERTITMTRADLTLFDSSIAVPVEESP